MYTICEVSRMTGVSVRALHHYDAIGLLPPTRTTQAGYRLYDGYALERLKCILIFRELRFPLREIAEFLKNPDFDPVEALDGQIEMLRAQKRRTEALIAYAEKLKKEGMGYMSFEVFRGGEEEALRREAKERWGETAAYREYEKRPHAQDAAQGLMRMLAEISALRPLEANAPVAREKAGALQKFITDNFYTCTDEIFAGLAVMYTEDERMKRNIDRACGENAAEYIRKVIEAYIRGNG